MRPPDIQQQITELNKRFSNSSPEEVLFYFAETYGHELAFSTSLGAEDQVLTHMLSNIKKGIRIFTLDTGRLFPETLDLLAKTNARYGSEIKVFFPDSAQVEKMVNTKGINLFYESVENRKACCNIRKIVPMKRALEGARAWISGLRAEQSITRKDLELVQWDHNFKLIKISPLRNWSEKDLWDYIHKNKVPYNVLHDKGFPSIGCQPCTRAVSDSEDIRAGRWWWELPDSKECGLHKK